MKSKTLYMLCLITSLICLSCEREKEKPVAEPSASAKLLPRHDSTSKTAPLQLEVKSGRGIPPSLEDAFAKMRAGAPRIPTMLKAWGDLWTGAFAEPLTDSAATQTAKLSEGIQLAKAQVQETLMGHLQNGQTLEGFDRGTLAGVYGLYVGWLNEPETSGQAYILLRRRCNELPQTQGDAILAVISQEAIDVIEPPTDLDEEANAGWKEIAFGKNPIYRQMALTLFPRLTNDPALRAEFLTNYAGELEPTIKEQVLIQLLTLPSETKESTLKQFKKAQSVNGDSIFNEKIQHAVDSLRN